MLHRVALVGTDVSEELRSSFIRVTRIGELGTRLAVTINRRTLRRNSSVRRLLVTVRVIPSSLIVVTLMKEALRSSETSVLTRATRHNIPEDAIIHSFLLLQFSYSKRPKREAGNSLPSSAEVENDELYHDPHTPLWLSF
jgi:hypothetical protein